MNVGYSVPGVVTGKPLVLGGSQGRSEATGRGCVFAIQEAAPTIGLDISKSRTVVQGFGNAGSVAARLMAESGSTVVGVSDSQGGIYHPAGLDLAAVRRHKARTGSVVGFAGGGHCHQRRTSGTRLRHPDSGCDGGPDRRSTTRPRSRPACIAEAANGPTSPEADAILSTAASSSCRTSSPTPAA